MVFKKAISMYVSVHFKRKYKTLGNLLSQRSRGKLLNLEMYSITSSFAHDATLIVGVRERFT